MSVIRALVSKKKKRFQDKGYDLDLSYVTDRIIAMGFPAEKMEGIYRNRREEVVRFLEEMHRDHYKIYNLCSERHYDPYFFHNRVARFPFDDHNVPPFDLIASFCKDMDEYFEEHPDNIAVVHCKAGKGRTGLMISAYMLHSKQWNTAHEALQFFAVNRTDDLKGVTIPSQKRYVHYFEQFTKDRTYFSPKYELKAIRFHSIPVFDYKGSCDAWFKIKLMKELVYSSKYSIRPVIDHEKDIMEFAVDNLVIYGDVKIEFYHRETFSSIEMFHFWFNTKFVDPNDAFFTREQLDRAHKEKRKKHFKPNFRLELVLNLIGIEDETVSRIGQISPDVSRYEQTVDGISVSHDSDKVSMRNQEINRLFRNMKPRGSIVTTVMQEQDQNELQEFDDETELMGFCNAGSNLMGTTSMEEMTLHAPELSETYIDDSLIEGISQMATLDASPESLQELQNTRLRSASDRMLLSSVDQYLLPHASDPEQVAHLANVLKQQSETIMRRIATPKQDANGPEKKRLLDAESWCKCMLEISRMMQRRLKKHRIGADVHFETFALPIKAEEDEDDEEDDADEGESSVSERIQLCLREGQKIHNEIEGNLRALYNFIHPRETQLITTKIIVGIALSTNQL